MQPWNIEFDAAGRGKVKHRAAPRFIAEWTTGDDNMPSIDGLHWTDEGSGGREDRLHIYGFAWHDAPPDQSTFDRLMKQAALFIDDWIASRF